MLKLLKILFGSNLFIKFLEKRYINKSNIHVDRILNVKISDVLINNERGCPGDVEFIASGYYKRMLFRYLFAGNNFCKKKRVLESCCGLGWGAFLISEYAKEVTAFDVDKTALDFCKKEWFADNISWIEGDALDFSFLNGTKFDVVLAMETIEHFTKVDGMKYIDNIFSVLEDGGYLIGTSSFPENREDADKLTETNVYHLYIWTKNEMEDLLEKYFKEYVIIKNWMFIAKK